MNDDYFTDDDAIICDRCAREIAQNVTSECACGAMLCERCQESSEHLDCHDEPCD